MGVGEIPWVMDDGTEIRGRGARARSAGWQKRPFWASEGRPKISAIVFLAPTKAQDLTYLDRFTALLISNTNTGEEGAAVLGDGGNSGERDFLLACVDCGTIKFGLIHVFSKQKSLGHGW